VKKVYLATWGWKVSGVSMNTHSRDLLGALRSVGVDAEPMPLPSPWGFRVGGWVLPWAQRLLMNYPKHKPDSIVHHVNADAWRGVDVVTIHDLSPWMLNGRESQRFTYVFIAHRAKKIVVTTEGMKEDIQRIIPVSRGKTFVVPVPFTPTIAERRPLKYDALWVGGNSPNKCAIDFVWLAQRHPEQRFAMVWSKGTYNAYANAYLETMAAVTRNLTSIHREVTDEELDKLYRSSRMCVSTSLYEGYHAPPMEAYLRGCHVLLPEMRPYTDIYPDDVPFWYFPESTSSMDEEFMRALDTPLRPPDPRVVDMVSYENVGRKLKAVYEQ
jgi:glycosyltransferase involved in cell wall biosynthesis